jgi:hypothetical protein
MTHSYPTRYQARLKKMAPPALVSDDEEENQTSNQQDYSMDQMIQVSLTWLTDKPQHLVPEPRLSGTIAALVEDAIKESDRFVRVFKSIRLFQHLEFHPELLISRPTFRRVVQDKIKEFTKAADKYIHQAQIMDPMEQRYPDAYAMARACEVLKKSCSNLQTIISRIH